MNIIQNVQNQYEINMFEGGKINNKPKIQILPNGLKVVYEKSPSILPITSIQAFVRLGSSNEVDGIRGVSHIIEHMVFKGTKLRPDPKQISQIFDETGAYLNAYTEKQYTCYVIKCNNNATKGAIKTLSDMLFNSIMKQEEYIKEYDVVIEEAKKSQDDIINRVYDGINKILYEGSSYEKAIDDLSYHLSKQRVSYNEAFNIYKSYYIPQNIVLSVVYSYSMSNIMKFIKNSDFAMFVEQPKIIHSSIREPILYLKPINKNIYIFDKVKQSYETTNIAIGFRVCNMYSNEKYILNLLKFVLVGPISSRFFHILRDENGLTYRTDVSITYYEHSGDFTIFTQVDNTKLIKNKTINGPGLIPLIFNILNDLRNNGITKEEFIVSKSYMQGILTRNLEDNGKMAEHNGNSVLFSFNELFSYSNKYNKCYKNITLNKINAIIKKYFKPDNMVMYICGSKIPVETEIKKFAVIK